MSDISDIYFFCIFSKKKSEVNRILRVFRRLSELDDWKGVGSAREGAGVSMLELETASRSER